MVYVRDIDCIRTGTGPESAVLHEVVETSILSTDSSFHHLMYSHPNTQGWISK